MSNQLRRPCAFGWCSTCPIFNSAELHNIPTWLAYGNFTKKEIDKILEAYDVWLAVKSKMGIKKMKETLVEKIKNFIETV